MNLEHFRAFLWLRWRLLVNQWRRGGRLNAVLMIVLCVAAVVTAVPLFAGSLWLGLYSIPKASPWHLLAAWDVLIVVFLFFWSVGLLSELQRSEPLALSKFLHLPVPATGAFLINFASSLLSLSLILFTPMMLGFALALVFTRGAVMLPSLLGLAAFLLMITALNYQFRGWLASLMSNPRRKRTVIAAATGIFILVTQLPNVLNLYAPWGQQRQEGRKSLEHEVGNLIKNLQAGEIDTQEFERRRDAAQEQERERSKQAYQESLERGTQIARWVNMALPVGWLPWGVMAAAEGNVVPSLLGLAGMSLIGAASLRRAYRGTIQLYQGEPSNEKAPAERPPARAASAGARRRDLIVEARLPGLSEPVSAVALGGFRSLMRAPEAKMMLLSSVVMVVVFGSLLMRGGREAPEWSRPLAGIGAIMFVLFGLSNVMANQFGLDRDGFRVFVLSAARRRDILLGKNLALIPLVLGLVVALLALIQTFRPMRLDHLLAMLPQFISMYLLDCILMNLLSIFAPVHVPSGSLRPANPSFTTVLLQLVTLMILLPMIQALTLVPLGVEIFLEFTGGSPSLPVCLLGTLVLCATVILIYALSLGWQGRLLQEREQRILEKVTARVA